MSTGVVRPCRFCSIAKGEVTKGSADSPWMETKEYMALVSIGALVQGWSLVVPREHTLNMAKHLACESTHQFIASAVQRLERQFGSVAIFEHGCAIEESITSCGVGHAHLHLVPLGFDLLLAARGFDQSIDWKECVVGEIEETVDGREYLFVANRYCGKFTKGLVAILDEGVSQFFRKVIAEKLGRAQQYSYREYPEIPTVVETLRILSSIHEAA